MCKVFLLGRPYEYLGEVWNRPNPFFTQEAFFQSLISSYISLSKPHIIPNNKKTK